jgi:creatinine amidohydrolase
MVLYELMRPDQVVAARDQTAVAFIPVGPLEWHGPHLPMGVDPMHAHEVAVRAAREVGGIVLPSMFAGTETVRPQTGAQSLRTLGLPEDLYIVGMDFPAFSVKSTYFEESAFGIAVREVVQRVGESGFPNIVIVNGHGAVNHQAMLRRVAAEANRRPPNVIYHLAFLPAPDARGPAHAAFVETAVSLAMFPDSVDCNRLPPDDEPLIYSQYGIVDAKAFDGDPSPGFALPATEHPRLATAEAGEKILSDEGAALAELVRELLHSGQ